MKYSPIKYLFFVADNQIVKSSPAHQQPPKIPFSPSPNQALTPSTTKEQTEADAEWQKYKFQRQILGVSIFNILYSK